MSLTQPQNLAKLYQEHKNEISLLKQATEENFPDLKGVVSTLKDGTKVDDLFYLRYVLSSKEPLTSYNLVKESKSLQHVREAIEWRNKQDKSLIESTAQSELMNTIPILRTGDLKNDYPLLFLPVKKVKLDEIANNKNDKNFREKLLELLLKQKSALFNEMDTRTRETGALIKSITVYDLHGLSYSHIFKMKDFFELVQAQKSMFKKLFPQSTELTVIVNSPGSFLLKSFISSSKQKVMSVKHFLKTFDARDAVPDLIGGNFVWPKDESQMLEVIVNGSVGSATSAEKEVKLRPCPSFDSVASGSTQQLTNVSTHKEISRKKKTNKKYEALEREMVQMKKNRIFSMDVREKNQKVNLFFTNLRKKDANILVVIKQEDGSISKNTAVLRPGVMSLSLRLRTEGEVQLVYLDEKKAARFGTSSKMDTETMNLGISKAKKALRAGKKKLNKAQRKKYHKQRQFDIMGLEKMDKVMFRFEVSDAVVCGQFGGQQAVTEEQLKQVEKVPSAPEVMRKDEQMLDCDYDAKSIRTIDSDEMKELGEPSFFKSAAQIFTRGW